MCENTPAWGVDLPTLKHLKNHCCRNEHRWFGFELRTRKVGEIGIWCIMFLNVSIFLALMCEHDQALEVVLPSISKPLLQR